MVPFPAGTVTFLFTDIEGSTQRWEQHPAAMQAALAQHDALMRAAFSSAGGAVLQTAGDSFVAVFPQPGPALAAALAVQRALLAAAWPPPIGAIRVRAALHSGPGEQREDGYHAEFTLNRLARLLAAGHGGQILVTATTRGLLDSSPPAEVQWQDLGEVWLKDLISPLHVYQVAASDLPHAFPPLKTLAAPGAAAALADAGTDPGDAVANPYKGLRAFGEADAPDFFGREDLSERLLARLGEAVPLARFLAVVGPSGSGKSSVVRAGVLPALRRGRLPGSERWLLVELIPGAEPLAELAAALAAASGQDPTTLLDQLQADEYGLLHVAQHLLAAPDPNPKSQIPNPKSEVVLLIDQFEEVFTLVAEEPARVQFLETLHRAVTAPDSPVRVIVTLRADFYDRPLLYPDPGELVRQRTEVVLPLRPEELARAIAGPAARVGVRVAPDLVAAVSQDVGEQPGTLPLVEYALTELFERRDGAGLTLAAYRAGGGLQAALGRRAEEIYGSLSTPAQELAREVFLRLVTLGEGAEDTRRRVRRAELAALPVAGDTLDGVLEAFSRYRLLTFDRDPSTHEPTVEVAHEALIRSWARLRAWLDVSRAAVAVQRQLGAAAAEWVQAGQEGSFLASGERLAQFTALAATRDVALTAEEQAYLTVSQAEAERRAAAEQARQGRELELARQSVAESQRAAAAQRSAAGRLRGLLAGAVVFLLVAAGLTVFAFDQSGRAQANAADANIQRATAVANGVETDRQRQLAQQSAATAVTDEATARREVAHAEALRLGSEAAHLLQTAGGTEPIALLGIRAMNIEYTYQGDEALTAAVMFNYPHLRLAGHTAEIQDLIFSPDGKSTISTSWDKTTMIWDALTGRLLHTLTGHSDPVYWAFPSADGKYLLTLGASNIATPKLWNTQTGELLHTFAGGNTKNAALSPDGKTVVIGTAEGVAKVFDAQSGQLLHLLHHFRPGQGTGQVGMPRTILPLGGNRTSEDEGFTPDGRTFITRSVGNKEIVFWDTRTWQELRRTPFTDTLSANFILSPDGNTMATNVVADNSIWLWDVPSGKVRHRITATTAAEAWEAFSPDSKLLLWSTWDGAQRLWDVQSGQEVRDLTDGTGPMSAFAAFAPDGQTIAVEGAAGGGYDTVRILNTQTGAELRRLRSPAGLSPAGGFSWFTFSPDGRSLLTGGFDGDVRLWDLQAPSLLPQFTGNVGIAFQSAFSADGNYVVGVGQDKAATVWDAHSGRLVRRFVGHTDLVDAGAHFSPDGRFIFTGSSPDHTVRLWDAQTGKELWRQTFAPSAAPNNVQYSPDGKYVLTALNDTTKAEYVDLLLDAHTGAEVRRLTGHTARMIGNAFSPDGHYVLTGSEDQTARLWDVTTGKEVRRFTHPDKVQDVSFSADSKWALTSSSDGIARIWDVQTGQQLKEFNTHSGLMAYVVASPDDKYLLTSEGGMARLWDIQSGGEVRRIPSYVSSVSYIPTVTFSPDGQSILTIAPDGTLRLLDTDYHATIRRLCGALTRDLTDAERTRFSITDATATCPNK